MITQVGVSTITGSVERAKVMDLTYEKLFLKAGISTADDKIIINYESLVDDYMEIINKSTYTIKLSNQDLEKYRYNPKYFCYDKYGTPELWFLLLRINNMLSITDFDRQTIKIFAGNIFKLLNEIIILEKSKYDETTKFALKE